jgi:hypothetical protein
LTAACEGQRASNRADDTEVDSVTEAEVRAEYIRIKNSVYEEWNRENEQICVRVLDLIAGETNYDVRDSENMKKNLAYVMAYYTQLKRSHGESDLLTFLFYKGIIEKDDYTLSDGFVSDCVFAFIIERVFRALPEQVDYSRETVLREKLNSELKKSGLVVG